MPNHNFNSLRGRIEVIKISSTALETNLLGDPASREVAIYLPEGYDDGQQHYPLFVDLVGFTGSGLSHLGWSAFAETVPQRLDRLVDEGKMGQVVLALPDCFTSLGGNQYINSAAMGNWADFLVADMIPAIESQFRIIRGREHRAVFGKSSGGYGAMVHGLLYADYWGAIACHSGDMGFEWVYRQDLPQLVRELANYDLSVTSFIEHIRSTRKIGDKDMHLLMMLAMAATYDPNPDQPLGIQLPVTLDTCELIQERWARWMAWDPLTLIQQQGCLQNIDKLKGIYIDCGLTDQYNLVYGARRMHKVLQSHGSRHLYEEFEDNHSGINYRMDHSLPYLYHALTGGSSS
jgi:S-formylglutathione hydrolase FrmB